MRLEERTPRYTSGFTGVTYNIHENKWQASVFIYGKHFHLGFHNDVISAALHRVHYEECCTDQHCDERQVNRLKLRDLGYRV